MSLTFDIWPSPLVLVAVGSQFLKFVIIFFGKAFRIFWGKKLKIDPTMKKNERRMKKYSA